MSRHVASLRPAASSYGESISPKWLLVSIAKRRDHLGKVFRVVFVENDEAVHGWVGELLGMGELVRRAAALAVELNEGLRLQGGRRDFEGRNDPAHDALAFGLAVFEPQIPLHRLDDESLDPDFKKVPQVFEGGGFVGVHQGLTDGVHRLPRKARKGIGFRIGREEPRNARGGFRGPGPVAQEVDAYGVPGIRRVKVRKGPVKAPGGVHRLVPQILVALGVENEGGFAPKGVWGHEGVEAPGSCPSPSSRR